MTSLGSVGGTSLSPGHRMRAEILEQPNALARFVDERRTNGLTEARALLDNRNTRLVSFVGRGTSSNAGLYGRYLTEARLSVASSLAMPSSVSRSPLMRAMRDTVCIAVSQSGASPDIVAATARARDSGAVCIAITNHSDSLLARECQVVVDLGVGPEVAIAATKSYTAELLALYMLLTGQPREIDELAAGLPTTLARQLSEHIPDQTLIGGSGEDCEMTFLGRGPELATAAEAALKIRETSRISATAFSSADYLHGPIASRSARSVAWLIATSQWSTVGSRDVATRLRGDAGVTHILSRGSMTGAGVVTLPDVIDDDAAPILDIAYFQLLALEMSLSRGLDPDSPTGLSKVTATF